MKREDANGCAQGETRRKFLKKTAGLVAGGTLVGRPGFVLGAGPTVTILLDPEDRSVSEGPVRWAAGQLAEALKARGLSSAVETAGQGTSAGDRVVVARQASVLARPVLSGAKATVPDAPEAVAIVRHGRTWWFPARTPSASSMGCWSWPTA